jgi:hypothetical protein
MKYALAIIAILIAAWAIIASALALAPYVIPVATFFIALWFIVRIIESAFGVALWFRTGANSKSNGVAQASTTHREQ